jgi:hypothetical protein
LNLGDWRAGFIIFAGISLGLVLVGSTLLADDVAVFSKEDVEVGPSSVAAFVHIIAGHEHLRRNNRRLLSVFELEPCLHHLSEGNGVAGTTVALVSEL